MFPTWSLRRSLLDGLHSALLHAERRHNAQLQAHFSKGRMNCSRQDFIHALNSCGCHDALRIQHLPDACRELAIWFFVTDPPTLDKTKEIVRAYLREYNANGLVVWEKE